MRPAQPPQEAAFDADQAELAAMSGGTTAIATGVRDEVISGEAIAVADDTEIRMPSWEQEQFGTELLAGAALEAIDMRKRILGDSYPFKIDRGAVEYVPPNGKIYEFCLLTSIAAARPQKKFQRFVRHFERLVRDLLIALAGGDSTGLRIGWPNEKDIDQLPRGFARKIQHVKTHCRFDDDEWTLDSCGRLDALRDRAKDARIDVIVRRSIGDGRPGGLTLLCQCGCGRNDVDDSSRKHEELSNAWLEHFFGRTSVPKPLRVFATSQHLVRDDQLYLKQSSANVLMLDRLRLVLLAKDNQAVVDSHGVKINTLMADFFS